MQAATSHGPLQTTDTGDIRAKTRMAMIVAFGWVVVEGFLGGGDKDKVRRSRISIGRSHHEI